MSIEIRKPNINAQDIEGQTAQIRSFLYELTNQLNWAMNTLTGEVAQVVVDKTKNDGSLTEMSAEEKLKTFNALKDLIIKSADIVEAYEQKMTVDFESKFTAIADIEGAELTYEDEQGIEHTVSTLAEYIEYMKNSIEASSSGITQNFDNIQTVLTQVQGDISDAQEDISEANVILQNIQAYIRTGLLDSGQGIYGVEVGQTTSLNGTQIFNKFARFTADRLSFYDSNGNEIGYYAGDKFYVLKGEVVDELKIGGYLIQGTTGQNGLIIKWVGRNV